MSTSRALAAIWRSLFYTLRPTEPFLMRTQYYRLWAHPRRGTLTRAIIRRGHWEPEETREFARFIRAGDFVIDAGANFGHYTFTAAQLVGPAGLVIGFEPHPDVFKLLAANAALQNRMNIVVEQAGLGSESGMLEITTDLGNPGGHSFVRQNVRQRGADLAVAVDTIDAYLRRTGLADRPLSLIKIDVQGFEAKVIAGAAAAITRHRPVVLCEVTPAALAQTGDSLETLLAFFQAMDYVASPIGAGDGGRTLGYDRLAALLQTSGREYWDVLFIPRERAQSLSDARRLRLAAAPRAVWRVLHDFRN